MLQKAKLPAAFILCLLLVYVWGFFLAAGGAWQMLPVSYVLVGITFCSIFFRKGRGIREYIYLSLAFGLFVGIVDISITALTFPGLFLLSLIDMGLKIALSVVGGFAFFMLSKAYISKRKIFKTDLGILSRRLVAALIDWNAVLLIIMALSLTALLSPTLGSNLVFIVSIETFVIFAYKVVQEAFDRTTIGKRITGIKIKGNPWQAMIRNSILVLFGITMFPQVMSHPLVNIIYVLMLGDIILFFTGRRLFDIIAGTSIELSEAPLISMRGRPKIRFSFS